MKDPLVSVIITTKNSASTLENLLFSIRKQTYKNKEIIVVDNNSKDKTLKIAKKYTKNTYIKSPERSVQRNYGVSKSKGKYILILDSDMVLTKDVIKECVSLISSSNSIKEIIIPEKSFGEGVWSKAKILEREMNEGQDYFESARFFNKKTFWEFEGFDQSMTGPEDWDLPQRIAKKYKVGRTKAYILHNEGTHTLLNLAKKKYYYGLSSYKYLKKQSLPLFGPTTVYFLRKGFYKKWYKLFRNPLISMAMILMLFSETIGGGLGYLVGRWRSEK